MKKLTEEESKDLIPLRSGRITLVYSELVQLKVGYIAYAVLAGYQHKFVDE